MGETKGVRRGGGENDRGTEEGGKEGWERKKEERRRGREKRRGGEVLQQCSYWQPDTPHNEVNGRRDLGPSAVPAAAGAH